MLLNIGIIFIIILFLLTLNFTFSYIPSVIAEKSENILNINDEEEAYNDKLVIVSNINLQNIEKKGFLKVVGVINGEDFVKNIPLGKLKDTIKILKVTFSMDKDNEIVSAHKLDEFFVCAYHFKNPNNNNNLKSISFNKKDTIEYFDCNEGDIKSTAKPTKVSLFKEKSQVHNKTLTYYNMYSKPKLISFDSLDNDTLESTSNTSVNIKLDKSRNSSSSSSDSSKKSVQVKIIVPMEDKNNATKIKIMTMLKGQIKSEIVDVQKEFDKIGGYTIERIFAFDRNTDMGPIQVGDRFHACIIGQELYPPEGSKCEKRLIKHLDKPNSLVAR